MYYRPGSRFLNVFLGLALLVAAAGGPGCGGGGGGGGGEQTAELPLVDDENEAAASHILIMHRDSAGAPPEITRSRDEAKELAHRVAFLANERGADFAELARKYSDDRRSAENGGYLGIFRRGDMVLPFDVTVFRLPIGRISGVVETDYGFHIIKRLPVQRVLAAHILIAWKGAKQASAAVTRTREQARLLAEDIRRQAAAPDADLCLLARRFSDDPNNRTRCGDLGVVQPGYLPEALDAVLFRLRPGEVSTVVESEFGYHVIWQRS
jgi:parvulin-like peptidyl-prolyl isomerase